MLVRMNMSYFTGVHVLYIYIYIDFRHSRIVHGGRKEFGSVV